MVALPSPTPAANQRLPAHLRTSRCAWRRVASACFPQLPPPPAPSPAPPDPPIPPPCHTPPSTSRGLTYITMPALVCRLPACLRILHLLKTQAGHLGGGRDGAGQTGAPCHTG